MRKRFLPALLVLSAISCASYVLPVPADFTAGAALPVTGASGFKQKRMTVGDYQISIDRSSTRGRDSGGDAVRDRAQRQSYSFVITLADSTVFTGGCLLSANETTVAAPAGIELTAREKAELECEMLPGGRGRESWRLELEGDPDNPLNGQLTGTTSYTIKGIGTAFGSTDYGPTGGYHIRQGERTVASVQVAGKRQVVFEPGARSDSLLAAAVVLLLIDESVRDLDD